MLGQSGAPAAAAAALGEALAAVPRPCRAAGAAGAAGCPTGAPIRAPLRPVLGAAAFPSSPSAGPAREPVPGTRYHGPRNASPFAIPRNSQLGTVFGYCVRGAVTRPLSRPPLTGSVTFLCQSQPSLRAGSLPAPPVTCSCRVPGVPEPQASREPSTFLGFLGLCHHSPPCQKFFYNPIHLCRPFVPVAGHSPMTLSICRLTAGSLPSPCTILHAGPFSSGTIPWLPLA